MAADLELFQDLKGIKLPQIKIKQPSTSEGSSGAGIIQTEEDKKKDVVVEEEEKEECSTPTSEENRIPAAQTCPPAPRKPKRRIASCKRKLSSEFEFFEIVNREEVDAFFAAADSSISKRRCPCT